MSEKRVSFDDLMKAPDGAPEWLGGIAGGLRVSDHVGDAHEAFVYHLPEQWREWAKRALWEAEYDEETDEYVYDEPEEGREQP